jgi:polygalacturonase
MKRLSALVALCALAAGETPAGDVFNVRDYGAKGDRQTNDRAAIQAAMDACAKAGGGTVVLPPGDYLSSALTFATGETLHLEKGATLWVATRREDYVQGAHNSEGAGARGRLLFADGAERIGVTGQGTINGQATGDLGRRWGAPETAEFRTGILLFQNCRDVTIRDVSLLYSDSWTVHLKRCEKVRIDGVTIKNNYRRLNSDGIDPNSCRDVVISRCTITAGDDAIVLKSTEPFPCENITVRDCVLESATAALKLGTESKGDFRDILFENCTIKNSPVGVGLYLKDGATMERITARNLKMEICDTKHHDVAPLFIDIEKRHPDSKVGTIRDVTFQDMDILTGTGCLLQGMPESPIERLTLRNITLRVEQPDDYAKRRKPVGGRRTTKDDRDTLYARMPSYCAIAHVKGLTVDGLKVQIGEGAFKQYERSALALRQVEDTKVSGVERSPGPEAGKVPVVDESAAKAP